MSSSFRISLSLIAGVFFGFITLMITCLLTATSFTEFAGEIRSPEIISAILLSLQTSIVVVLLALLFGIPAAYILATKQFKGKNILDTLVDLPIVLPPLVCGLAILIAFGGEGILSRFDVLFTVKGIIIAQLFVASPFLIRAAKTAFESVDPDVVDAARTLGASEFYTFRKVSLPLAKNGIASGVVMTWARALGEFGATAMVAGCIPYRTETMTVGIYMHAMSGNTSASVALSMILIVIAFTTLILFKYLGNIGDGNTGTQGAAA
ncbi:MAG: molybdate ABC transporter permease subunit [Methanosarcinales archaeon]|nr:MAG: molybdate ABC transporter permease subunit [Methanosarcinales archaeon]